MPDRDSVSEARGSRGRGPDERTKIYVMATPCTGKTTFCRRYPIYRGLRMVDFSRIHRSALREPAAASRGRGESYHARLHRYFRHQDGPLCVLGRRGPAQPQDWDEVILVAVLLPEADHRSYSGARRARRPRSRWGDYSLVEEKRRELAAYAEAHGIAVHDSIAVAIDAALAAAG